MKRFKLEVYNYDRCDPSTEEKRPIWTHSRETDDDLSVLKERGLWELENVQRCRGVRVVDCLDETVVWEKRKVKEGEGD